MPNLLTALVDWIVRRPRLALAVAAVPFAVLAWPAATVPVDNSLAVWFVEDDPALERYRSLLDTSHDVGRSFTMIRPLEGDTPGVRPGDGVPMTYRLHSTPRTAEWSQAKV